MNYHIELFHSLLDGFLDGESAILTATGESLALRGQESLSYGTLATAGATAAKYLALQEGDIALMNDPYSGGSLLNEMTFVMALTKDLLWVSRKSLSPCLKLTQNIEEEGLRIPPTPLRQKGQLNEMILAAMQAHPACPAHFTEWLKKQVETLTVKAKSFHNAISLTGFTISAELIQNYISACKQVALQKISERASGEARVDVVLDNGELLRLNLEIHDGKVAMDFGGTSGVKTVVLTEAAAYGVCLHKISQFYGFQEFANSGSFSVMQITKPSGCWLMGKYPSSTYKGMVCGVAALKTALDLALAQIHSKQEHAIDSHCGLRFHLEHQGQEQLLVLNGGKAAASNQEGSCAEMQSFSVEQLERDFPVRILRIDQRNSEGGKGKRNGGRGLILKMEVKKEVQGSWMTDLTLFKPRLPKNCSAGDSCEVSLESKDTSVHLPPLGQKSFAASEILTLCSGSGGGIGRVE